MFYLTVGRNKILYTKLFNRAQIKYFSSNIFSSTKKIAKMTILNIRIFPLPQAYRTQSQTNESNNLNVMVSIRRATGPTISASGRGK